jgi:4-hydroxy-2-oxoheptanedioate aldolase
VGPTPDGAQFPGKHGLRARLAAGEALAGTFVKSRDPSTTEALAAGGLDFVIADLEHSPLSVSDTEGIARACAAWDLPVLARIPPTGIGLIGALLDVGVTGIQVSDVTSAAMAEAVRAAGRYPPLGERSLSVATRAARFGAVRATTHMAVSNDRTVLVGQVESIAGIEALPSIIETGAFDALFIGATDLSVSLGYPAHVGHPVVAATLSDVASAIVESGTPLGIFCANASAAVEWAARGASLLAISSDLTMLTSAATATAQEMASQAALTNRQARERP